MKLFKQARKYGARVTAAATGLMFSVMASAQTVTGVDAALDAVDLSGVSTKVAAAALLIVGIALVFKGPDLAKRVIRKV